MPEALTILGIESSCDDTAAALVRRDPAGLPQRQILASIVLGQNELHADFGGVVPEIAARAHAERLDLAIVQALNDAGLTLGQIDGIAVTAGPGLIGGVLAGVACAKAIAAARNLPLLGINHLAGHALTPRLTDGIDFPYLMLLVSGGHCQFLIVNGPDSFRRIGGTIDDAPGEAFDKIAKLLGLGYPGGPEIENQALGGDPARFPFPRPLLDRPGCDVSFSGLKTSVRRQIDALAGAGGGLTLQDRSDICASFQRAVADVLAEKTRRACSLLTDAASPVLAVAGGVAANRLIGASLKLVAAEQGFAFVAPPLALCTDNAAMIAWAGIELWHNQDFRAAAVSARPRWPLDSSAAPLIGSGRKGAKA